MRLPTNAFIWQALMGLALSAAAPPPPQTDVCPVLPVPPLEAPCGVYTYRYCDTPNKDCKACGGQQTEYGLTVPYTGYPLALKPYLVDVGDYLFYHMLQVEYLVEFSKNPMPYQKKVDLPYCGLDNSKAFAKRGLKWPKIAVGGTAKDWGKKIGDAIAAISPDVPWVDNDPPEKPTFKIPKIKPPAIPRPVCIPTSIKVPVHFTIFATNYTTASHVDAVALEAQIDVINKAFAPLGISFYMASLSSHVGTEWNRFTKNQNGGPREYYDYAESVKARNRYGGNDEVNVWIVESIGEPDCETGSNVAGYCSLARFLTNANRGVDGCAITIDSLPGVAWRSRYPGDGAVLTHELGHWFDLPHVFSDEPGCPSSGDSDGVPDTYQFSNDRYHIFDGQQARCCRPSNSESKYDPCYTKNLVNVTNYMSYSGQAGQWNPEDDPGTQPWTAGQRAKMFSSFFTLRRPPPPTVGDTNQFYADCENGNYPIWKDQSPSETRQLFRRAGSYYRPHVDNAPVTTRDLHGDNLFAAGPYLLEHLQAVCSKPPTSDDADKVIDAISGEVITCSAVDGTCQPPRSGARCPDGSKPPCQLGKYCADGSLPNPTCPTVYPCTDGTMPPCPDVGGINICPGQNPPGNPSPSKPPPSENPPRPGGPGYPDYGPAPSTCPVGCNPHSNRCDAATAPTCIYPDPRVSKPRAACACRPGYKASRYGDADRTKQWRLPIPGQEHRVWVAEGVVCDKECVHILTLYHSLYITPNAKHPPKEM
ncbi:hypothetical protein B0T18DRAFT_468778 [Schizothecium vesticola]|uniref:Peptidase M43 pregnancy-associated plasma-A domain-containing protein n=1 Tax=Schizothecium vesticola TaxID=314040 RepID=A0AA40EQ74_9PEZI|nr:hypothetical protein B0T18DRAFT_468778 [Schizothecium vesticola]